MVLGGYIPSWTNTLARLLSSCICFQDQNITKSSEILALKIRPVQVFKRHRGTGSLLEPKRWGEHCKCAFLSTAIENKWLSVAKYQWIRELRPMPIKSFSCRTPFLWALHPPGWINCMFFGRKLLDKRELASQALQGISCGRLGHSKFPPHSLTIP